MVITISPAKLLDFETPSVIKEYTNPQFADDAEYLNGLLKPFSVEEIKKMMSINPKQAHQVYQYIHSFDMDRVSRKQAALAYNGIAYLGLNAETFISEDWAFAQEHLISLSGL
jgi:cytoplasmic iron level regulating protein YaaA (DUF328/UPF0246 family)